MSVGGVAPVEEVSVGGGAPVDVVGVGSGAPEVLLSDKQGHCKNGPSKNGSPELLFLKNFLELILLQNTPYDKLNWTTSQR